MSFWLKFHGSYIFFDQFKTYPVLFKIRVFNPLFAYLPETALHKKRTGCIANIGLNPYGISLFYQIEQPGEQPGTYQLALVSFLYGEMSDFQVVFTCPICHEAGYYP